LGRDRPMKKILLWTLLIVGTLFLTKFANDAAQDVQPRGATFRMTRQKVVSCGSGEIVLSGPEGPTRLLMDDTWPSCSTFDAGQYYDLWLARGGKTGFITSQKSPWWRTVR
jgi:hypothetical protein